jgi:hypothetical protein
LKFQTQQLVTKRALPTSGGLFTRLPWRTVEDCYVFQIILNRHWRTVIPAEMPEQKD